MCYKLIIKCLKERKKMHTPVSTIDKDQEECAVDPNNILLTNSAPKFQFKMNRVYNSALFDSLSKEEQLEFLENIAKKILIKATGETSLSSDAIDIFSLVKNEGFLIQTMYMDPQTTGMLLVDDEHPIEDTGSNKLIIIGKFPHNDNSYFKGRFITAHEYAHYILHKHGQQQFAHRDQRSSDCNDLQEWQADTLARCLLMPQDQMKKLIQKHVNEDSVDIGALVDCISSRFMVTQKKAMQRLDELGYLGLTNLPKEDDN